MGRELRGRGLLLAVSTLTSLGFMLVGYDNGLMGGIVNSPAFNGTFRNLESQMVGLIVGIFDLGCVFGSIGAAVFGERLGRRRTIGHGCWIMTFGAVLQATSYSHQQLIVGRVVSGIGLGIVNSTVPVLQAEFSPRASRGKYVCAQISTLNFGIFLVYWIGYAFSSAAGSYAWRVPVILQCFCIIPVAVIAKLIPETPRWLAAHDRPDECLRVLARMQSASTEDDEVLRIHGNILQAVALESSLGSSSWMGLFETDQVQSRKRLLLACAIQIFQQLGGINAIIYYTSTIFEKSIGFSPHTSALMSGILHTWFFIASFIPWFLIDRIGRKPLLLSMISLMAVVMAMQAGFIHQAFMGTAGAYEAAIGAAVMLFIFQGAFTVGFQATVWVYPSEILPLRLRQRGSSLSTAANWIFNYIIVQVTPVAIERIGWGLFAIFGVLNAIWIPLILIFFPETKGLELEDVDRLFAKHDIRANPALPETNPFHGRGAGRPALV